MAWRTGDRACPNATLYWHFLLRHEAALLKNPRVAPQAKQVARLGSAEREAIAKQAAAWRSAAAAWRDGRR